MTAPSELMTRAEAICIVIGNAFGIAGEFCVGSAEVDACLEETNAALKALGVTQDEIDAA